MSKTRYIADLHFGHKNILRFDNRPFETLEEMQEKLIENWNKAVEPGDLTCILGDFCWSGSQDVWIDLLRSMNGRKVLVRGNHDLKQITGKLAKMLDDIKDYKEIKDNGRLVIMQHYPNLFYRHSFDPNTYMLCGHVHTTVENDFLERWRSEMKASNIGPKGQIYNVGCMMPWMGYTPRTLDEIIHAHG